MAEIWDELDTLSDDERTTLFAQTTAAIRNDAQTLAERLEDVGWVFYNDAVVRPDDLRNYDVEAISYAEELIGHQLPGFLKQFALDVGAVFLGGHAAEGSPLADAIESLMHDEGVAEYAPLNTIPLPNGIDELEMAVEDEFEVLGVPIIEDPVSAVGISGGPPLCLLFDGDNPHSTELFVDFEPDDDVGIDFVRYIRTCLSQGGFFHEDPFLIELGEGLGDF